MKGTMFNKTTTHVPEAEAAEKLLALFTDAMQYAEVEKTDLRLNGIILNDDYYTGRTISSLGSDRPEKYNLLRITLNNGDITINLGSQCIDSVCVLRTVSGDERDHLVCIHAKKIVKHIKKLREPRATTSGKRVSYGNSALAAMKSL